jgi:6-phosphogluconolactonase/glucosamine-6-phosphate isomerase/deaminase
MIRVEVLPDTGAAAARAAEVFADAVLRAIAEGRRFAWAISGGEGPLPMFRRLDDLDLPWDLIETWQVDERVAPQGDPDRNASHQMAALPSEAMTGVRWMPVEEEDLDVAAVRYAATLPARFDVVHLGLGADGHTASLVPEDPVLDVRDRDVAVTGPYEGRRRMTLTYPGLSRAAQAIWLVTGPEKRDALEKLIAGDRSIPATRVPVEDQFVVTDRDLGPGRLREDHRQGW